MDTDSRFGVHLSNKKVFFNKINVGIRTLKLAGRAGTANYLYEVKSDVIIYLWQSAYAGQARCWHQIGSYILINEDWMKNE